MMHDDNTDTTMDLLAVAAADSFRWWLNVDGPVVMTIEDETSQHGGHGLLTARAVETISKFYGFRRTMPATDAHDQMVADTFNSHVRVGDCLKVQALGLRDVVEALSAKSQEPVERKRARNLASGASKLSWFVQPMGWTPFDSIAATGLGVANGEALTRMVRFYDALDTIQFPAMAVLVNEHVDRSRLECQASNRNRLRGERILDRFLMFRGMEPPRREQEVSLARAFLRCLPAVSKMQLVNLMDALRADESLAGLLAGIDRRAGAKANCRAA